MEISKGYAIVLTLVSHPTDSAQPNILVDATSHARITDFGLATVTRDPHSVRSASGDQGHNARWTAPEILMGQGSFSKEADIFSLAMVMIEVRCESLPGCRALVSYFNIGVYWCGSVRQYPACFGCVGNNGR